MCLGDPPPLDGLDKAKIARVEDVPCEHKTFLYQLVRYPPFPVQEQSVYQACQKNELWSLTKRHLLHEGEPAKEEMARCVKIADALAEEVELCVKATPEQVVAHKGSPQARKRYLHAFWLLFWFGVSAAWHKISAFVKVEKWPVETIGSKVPRLIQFRSYMYCGRLAQYLMPIEKNLWKYKRDGISPFAKSMCSFKVASTLVKMSERFQNPVYVLADHSKFDSCVTKPWILLEKRFYMKLAYDEELEALMDIQLKNVGYTKNGVKYTCDARKMSGEYNTSLGDTLINYCILSDVFRKVDHRLLVNGDDSVIVLERSDLNKVDLGESVWKRYGFKTKVDIVEELSQVEFCQAKPINLGGGVWRMVREPWRAIGRSCVSVKRYQNKAWYGLVAAMGYSELACGTGVPMMQAWARYLMRASCGAKPLPHEISQRARLERRVQEDVPVTLEARQSFAESFGIGIDQQLDFEQWCELADGEVLPVVYGCERPSV